MQKWILPELRDKVEFIVQDLQAEQKQGTQAKSWVARIRPIHLPPVHLRVI